MKCMNPKCDSKEFSMGSMVSLTDMDNPAYHWVTCDVCGMAGPEGDTKEEAKSYFEEKKESKYVTPGVYITKPKSAMEYAAIIESITPSPAITRDEILNSYNTWYSEFMEQIAREADIPKEVLEMKFDSGFSLARTALKELEIIRRYENAATSGRRLYEAFLNELYHSDPVIERDDPSPVPMEFYIPEGPGFTMSEFYKGKVLGIPFDMGKERGGGIRKPMTREPLIPGPTQITDRPPPEITAPTINMANYTNECDCGAPAYRGYTKIECTDPACKHWVKPKP